MRQVVSPQPDSRRARLRSCARSGGQPSALVSSPLGATPHEEPEAPQPPNQRHGSKDELLERCEERHPDAIPGALICDEDEVVDHEHRVARSLRRRNGATIVGEPRRKGPDVDDVPSLRTGSDAAVAGGPAGVVAGGPLGAPRQRPGGRCGFDGVLRAVCGGRSAQRALCTADDGEGAAVCVCDGGVLVARDRAEAGRGRGVPGSGGGQLPATSDAVRVPAAALVGLQGAVCSGGSSGALREAVD